MPTNKRIQFTIDIDAPVPVVFRIMLDHESYKDWTTAFAEGSYYVGCWQQGQKIKFMAPSGDGMVSEIAEHRVNEFTSIRHLGYISKGVEDTQSESIRAWAPAYETYAFADAPGGCTLTVTVDTLPEYEDYMRKTFPEALSLLKALCEKAAR